MSVVANAIDGKLFTYISPSINLKATGQTTIFTTQFGLTFVPINFTIICDAASAANGNAIYNIGWTAAAFADYISGNSFTLATATTFLDSTIIGTNFPIFPASTAIKCNVTNADTGTSITGRVIFNGFYIQ